MALPCFEEALVFYAQNPVQYKKKLKNIGSLAATCYQRLLQDETLSYYEQLKADYEEFKKMYSKYIDDKE